MRSAGISVRIFMESLDVFTQQELEEALARPGVIPICSGEGSFEVGGDHFVRAADWARVGIGDRVLIEAGGTAAVTARDQATVRARNSVTVDAADTVTVDAGHHAFVRAGGRCRVLVSSHAVVKATQEAAVIAQARASVRATDRCHVRARTNASVTLQGEARAWLSEMAHAQASEHSVVSAWGWSHVFASGSARVEAHEFSVVIAGGSTAVKAFGSAMVRARAQAQVEAGSGVAVLRHGPGVSVTGGSATSVAPPRTVDQWCEYYGVEVADGVATLFKAVDDEFGSYHGTSYAPGSTPQATDWDGGEQECGGGLHFSPRPTFAFAATDDATRFVACPVRVEDIVIHRNAVYPHKVKAPGVCAPVYEVDLDGTPAGDYETA